MSIWGIEPSDWFTRFMRNRWRAPFPEKDFGEFDDMRREMERIFEEQFQEIQSSAPKGTGQRIRNARRWQSKGDWTDLSTKLLCNHRT